MAEGGGLPWSSRRRRSRRERERENRENSNEDVEQDLLRVVLSDSEDFVPEDVKSTTSVACGSASDCQDEESSNGASCDLKSCPNLSDLDPEVRRRAQIQNLRRLASKVTGRKRSKPRKKSSDDVWSDERDENGLGYYARCLQAAKKVRQQGEMEAIRRRENAATRPPPRRRRPLSMINFRAGNGDEEMPDPRRRRFSFSWGFRRDTEDSNLGDTNADLVENNHVSASPTPPSPPQAPQSTAMSLEEFHRQKREKARLKAAQHRLEYFLISDIVSITNCPWYWGKMNRFQAEKVLEGYPDGTFLLRDSAQYHYLFSVSFRRYSRTYHARIEQWKHKYSFDKPSDYSFYSTSVCQLLQHYSRADQCMYYEPLLLKPLQRKVPASLQDHCRAAICSQTTFQGVSELPLPNSLKVFLREFHYKVPVKRTEEKGTQTPAPRKRQYFFS